MSLLAWPRLIWRSLLLLLWLSYGGLLVALCYPLLSPSQQRRMRQQWCQQLLRCLGIELRMPQSAPLQAAGQLLVANHISWLDIIVLGACMPMDFVAKAELRHWPFLGWLAAKNHTWFLPRHQARQAQAMNTRLSQSLAAGNSIMAFPEGTTHADGGVLPFYPAIFQAAIDAACRVQPLALAYRDAAGAPSCTPAYTADTNFVQSLMRIMAAPSLQAHVRVCPAIAPALEQQRRHLASQARSAIVAQLPPAAQSKPEALFIGSDIGSEGDLCLAAPLPEAAC